MLFLQDLKRVKMLLIQEIYSPYVHLTAKVLKLHLQEYSFVTTEVSYEGKRVGQRIKMLNDNHVE